MNDSEASCTKCETPLPAGAAFCPACGTATPTELTQETGVASVPQSADTSEEEFRERLQRALGEA